jgi:hypothetical protein
MIYPLEVCHALDFFIWSALDDHALEPQEPRPFGDDERYYNALLNRQFEIDVPSTAVMTEMRLGDPEKPRREGVRYWPYYFPDEYLGTHSVAKDGFVINYFSGRVGILEKIAPAGRRINGPPSLPSRDVLINPNAYTAFFPWCREEGYLFASATSEERESVTIAAPMAAVIAPGVEDESRVLFTDGWVKVPYQLARQVIQDFLDPEALLL